MAKFKVGDRIIVRNSSAYNFNGMTGVVTLIRDNKFTNNFVTVLLDAEGVGRNFLEKSLELDETKWVTGKKELEKWLNQR